MLNGRSRQSNFSRSADPPLSPRASTKRKYVDGTDEKSPGESRISAQDVVPESNHHERLDAREPRRNGSFESPPRPPLGRLHSRKRSYRDSSEESEEGPKRQVDDITPKFKRRQPQVASAYR